MASMWQQYKALPPRTRMYIGLGGMAFSLVGLYISDAMEDKLDPARRQAGQTAGSSAPVETAPLTPTAGN
ncbi:hypothetical protein BGZ83_004181 [Gryganskiella cystojenkinii]|nr:hypothetical protein BGZ83_004181 [Gryganskiella cystojenkinii]